MIEILINGCYGKMGRAVADAVSAYPDMRVVGGIDKVNLGTGFTFPVFSSFSECELNADVVIDFTRPETLGSMLNYSRRTGAGLVIATTGHSDEEMAMIVEHAKSYPVFKTRNMSLGVNLMVELLKKAASFLGNDFEVEIIEKHHNQKVDAPSGTALMLAEAINQALDEPLEYVYGRESKTQKRDHHEMGIHAIRGGNIVGEHEVLFIGAEEVIEIKHSAQSRNAFAQGALRAARFICRRSPGYYTMSDLLADSKF